jgi:hypothetical protein
MKFSKQKLINLSPCKDGLAFARLHKFNWADVWNNCERGDWLIWWLRQTAIIDKPTSVRISIECAAHVLPKFEARNPGDPRPRAAIEFARKWLADPTLQAAAYAAADTAAAERKWQAKMIREVIRECPFESEPDSRHPAPMRGR